VSASEGLVLKMFSDPLVLLEVLDCIPLDAKTIMDVGCGSGELAGLFNAMRQPAL
jgi:ribosomal protein L11 methylase PrmA